MTSYFHCLREILGDDEEVVAAAAAATVAVAVAAPAAAAPAEVTVIEVESSEEEGHARVIDSLDCSPIEACAPLSEEGKAAAVAVAARAPLSVQSCTSGSGERTQCRPIEACAPLSEEGEAAAVAVAAPAAATPANTVIDSLEGLEGEGVAAAVAVAAPAAADTVIDSLEGLEGEGEAAAVAVAAPAAAEVEGQKEEGLDDEHLDAGPESEDLSLIWPRWYRAEEPMGEPDPSIPRPGGEPGGIPMGEPEMRPPSDEDYVWMSVWSEALDIAQEMDRVFGSSAEAVRETAAEVRQTINRVYREQARRLEELNMKRRRL